MARLIDRVRRPSADVERSALPSLVDYQQGSWSYGGVGYSTPWMSGLGSSYKHEPVQILGEGHAYSSSGVAFAVVGRRVDLFSQVRFAWRKPDAAPRPMASDLFIDEALTPLGNPAEFLAWWESDQAWAGNAFAVRDGPFIRRLVPWWVTIVLTSERFPEHPEHAWDAKVAGYLYQPPGSECEIFLADEVAHYFNRPDPEARFRGMSYLRPVLRNIANTEAAERYYSQFWENAAVPHLGLKFPAEMTRAAVEEYADLFEERHAGLGNAWKTGYFGGGADPVVLGAKLGDLATKEIQASEFAQVCAAAGVPPVIVTMVPGLEASSTFNNYAAALREFADLTVRPLWLKAANALQKILGPVPAGCTLWPDASGIAALQEDAKDDAEVQGKQATTIATLVREGWKADAVLQAVTTGDMTKLIGEHSGLYSVQLQPPGSIDPEADGDKLAPGELESIASASGGSAESAALTLSRLYLAVNAGLLTADEARSIANMAGAGLQGPAPEKPTPAPSPFDQPPTPSDPEGGIEETEP